MISDLARASSHNAISQIHAINLTFFVSDNVIVVSAVFTPTRTDMETTQFLQPELRPDICTL